MHQQKLTSEEKTQRVLNELAFAAGWRSVSSQEIPLPKIIRQQTNCKQSSEEAFSIGRRFAIMHSETHLLLLQEAVH